MKKATLLIENEGDAVLAAKRAQDFAAWLGFSLKCQWEVAIVASELASNILKFAGQGTIGLEAATWGLRLTASDTGPGIAEPARAFEDGYATQPTHMRRRGSGLGLGTVRRLMDAVSLDPHAPGTRIVAEKWLDPTRSQSGDGRGGGEREEAG